MLILKTCLGQGHSISNQQILVIFSARTSRILMTMLYNVYQYMISENAVPNFVAIFTMVFLVA
jgi:hypothetical protein